MTISFKEKDKNFIEDNPDKKRNRKFKNRFILATNFSFYADKYYIDSAFINEEKRKNSIDSFNKLFNQNNKLKYIY